MRTLKRPATIFVVAMLLAVVPATSAIFTIHLKNGNTFESRYQPKVAEWDEDKVVLLTGVGNRITLHKDDIANISTDTQARGFGTVIDTRRPSANRADSACMANGSTSPMPRVQRSAGSISLRTGSRPWSAQVCMISATATVISSGPNCNIHLLWQRCPTGTS